MVSLDSDVSAYERVRSLFEFQPAEGDALINKLTLLTHMYRSYSAEYKQVQAILSKSDWIEPTTRVGQAAGGGEIAGLSSAVTLEGLQAHTVSRR